LTEIGSAWVRDGNDSKQWWHVWQQMDSKFSLRAKQAQRIIWCTIITVKIFFLKKKKKKKKKKKTQHEQEIEILRKAQE
jgi:hypothetical protein